jgi:hypothetical protein
LRATISQAETAMVQLSEQSEAVQNEVVEDGKRKIAKLKEQQRKKIAQLKTDHCTVAENIYTRFSLEPVFVSSLIVTPNLSQFGEHGRP